jgi:hypothetical protein
VVCSIHLRQGQSADLSFWFSSSFVGLYRRCIDSRLTLLMDPFIRAARIWACYQIVTQQLNNTCSVIDSSTFNIDDIDHSKALRQTSPSQRERLGKSQSWDSKLLFFGRRRRLIQSMAKLDRFPSSTHSTYMEEFSSSHGLDLWLLSCPGEGLIIELFTVQ